MFPLKDENPTELTPFVTLALIVANVATWLLVQGAGIDEARFIGSLCSYGAIPAEITGTAAPGDRVPIGPYECPIGGLSVGALVTSMFLHGSWMHLIGNMWFLWVFGNNIEDSMGHVKFLVFYLLTGLVAALAHVLSSWSSGVPTVGASGAISGVMGAYILLYPHVRVHTLLVLVYIIRVVELPAVAMLGLWFALQLLQGFVSAVAPGGGVAFWAHVGGFVAGVALVKLFARPKLVRAKREHRQLRPSEVSPWDRF
jgi:membrane associated rhomboid family serine protease